MPEAGAERFAAVTIAAVVRFFVPVIVLAVTQFTLQFGVQAFLHEFGDGFLKETLDNLHAGDIAQLQQLPDLCPTGLFFRASVLSTAHSKPHRITKQEEIVEIMRRKYIREDYGGTQRAVKQTGGKESGGHNYKADSDASKRDRAAAEAYRRFSRDNDAGIIAKNTGFSEKVISEIRRHIFFDKHKLYDGYGRFEPDYDMAVAWERMRQGSTLPRDITLLRHELLESRLEKEYNLTASEAHGRASQKYDWWDQLVKEIGEDGEPDGLL